MRASQSFRLTRGIRSARSGLPVLCLALSLAAGACSRDSAAVDAELARDLELATAQPAQQAEPELNDGPADAPELKVAAPTPRRAPARRTAAPRPSVPQQTAPRVDTTTLRSQTPAPVVEVAQQSAPAPFRGVLAGTTFGVATRSQVCTNNLPGDKIVGTVTSAVVGEDGATIPAGSTVVLEVASAAPGETAESAQLTLRVRSVVIQGEAHRVDGDVAIGSTLERGPTQASGSDRKKVIGGAIAGAIIGQVVGRDTRGTVIGAAAGAAAGSAAAAATRKYHACLPAGADVRVTTSQNIAL